jgi:hypothetical protein
MFFNNLYLEQLYISYNNLTFKCIESLNKKANELKVLHIAKYFLRYTELNSSKREEI